MKIIPTTARPSRRGPAAYFTGTVWLDEVVATPAPPAIKVVRVSFEPAARTAWHTHPLGQSLHVLSGLGLIQRKGDPVLQLVPGDTVWIEAGEEHWHGAAPTHTMVHLAIQQADSTGSEATWLAHVTDDEYSS